MDQSLPFQRTCDGMTLRKIAENSMLPDSAAIAQKLLDKLVVHGSHTVRMVNEHGGNSRLVHQWIETQNSLAYLVDWKDWHAVRFEVKHLVVLFGEEETAIAQGFGASGPALSEPTLANVSTEFTTLALELLDIDYLPLPRIDGHHGHVYLTSAQFQTLCNIVCRLVPGMTVRDWRESNEGERISLMLTALDNRRSSAPASNNAPATRKSELNGWEIVREPTEEEAMQLPPPVAGRFVMALEPPTLDGIAQMQGVVRYCDRHEHLMLAWKNSAGIEVLHQTDGLILSGHNDASWLPAGWEMDVYPAGWKLPHLQRWFQHALIVARITERPDLPNIAENQLCSILGPSYAPTPRGLVHHAFLILRHLAFPGAPKEPTFHMDWPGCIAALREVANFIEQAMTATDSVPSETVVDNSVSTLPVGSPKSKEPSKDAYKAYRLAVLQGKNQTEIAEILTAELRRPVTQGQVSRWIKKAKAWIKAGNVFPDLLEQDSSQPVKAMDPDILDRGARQDRRTKRQRDKRTDDD